ncbi:hypothetical protein [Mucilaginibacter xinganensis]|uniref:Uncharacterized protein n=1 Tax=Mucilaginibacter xinganensis TaxID=1234841 RepID=A0A223P331_9SPHI|nr:hypothetical protein [Mucilaginibacter xinganensis]ASU36549.1 hypothetical protein MuYL_4666 [Mucilaginibacter xinganensis]
MTSAQQIESQTNTLKTTEWDLLKMNFQGELNGLYYRKKKLINFFDLLYNMDAFFPAKMQLLKAGAKLTTQIRLLERLSGLADEDIQLGQSPGMDMNLMETFISKLMKNDVNKSYLALIVYLKTIEKNDIDAVTKLGHLATILNYRNFLVFLNQASLIFRY